MKKLERNFAISSGQNVKILWRIRSLVLSLKSNEIFIFW